MIRNVTKNVPEHVEEIGLENIWLNSEFYVLSFSDAKSVRKPITKEQLEAIVKLLKVDEFEENGIKVQKEKKE